MGSRASDPCLTESFGPHRIKPYHVAQRGDTLHNKIDLNIIETHFHHHCKQKTPFNPITHLVHMQVYRT